MKYPVSASMVCFFRYRNTDFQPIIYKHPSKRFQTTFGKQIGKAFEILSDIFADLFKQLFCPGLAEFVRIR